MALAHLWYAKINLHHRSVLGGLKRWGFLCHLNDSFYRDIWRKKSSAEGVVGVRDLRDICCILQIIEALHISKVQLMLFLFTTSTPTRLTQLTCKNLYCHNWLVASYGYSAASSGRELFLGKGTHGSFRRKRDDDTYCTHHLGSPPPGAHNFLLVYLHFATGNSNSHHREE